MAGGMRLAAFLGVLALIVGTSVSLASADQRDGRAEQRRQSTSKTEPQGPPAPAPARAEPAAAGRQSGAATKLVTAAAGPAAAAEPAAATTAPPATGAPTGELPFTGPTRMELPLLAGAILVLSGMLVQIAGQPLPARRSGRD